MKGKLGRWLPQKRITQKIHSVVEVAGVSYNNKHKEVGQRTSKIERWIAVRIQETFPGLEVHLNRKDAIESELDIYIPSLKLAFELQGITHYKAIFGEDRLAGEQKNDQDKRDKCKELGIQLVEVDVSKIKDFKKSIPFMMAVDQVLTTIKLQQSLISHVK